LKPWTDLRGKRAQRRRSSPRVKRAKRHRDHLVDAGAQAVERPVPRARSGVPFGEHLVALAVVEDELVIGKHFAETPPEATQHGSVQVVFRPDLLADLIGLRPELRPI
jgi:hypothetical protein